jgi:hypothetical protein
MSVDGGLEAQLADLKSEAGVRSSSERFPPTGRFSAGVCVLRSDTG